MNHYAQYPMNELIQLEKHLAAFVTATQEPMLMDEDKESLAEVLEVELQEIQTELAYRLKDEG